MRPRSAAVLWCRNAAGESSRLSRAESSEKSRSARRASDGDERATETVGDVPGTGVVEARLAQRSRTSRLYAFIRVARTTRRTIAQQTDVPRVYEKLARVPRSSIILSSDRSFSRVDGQRAEERLCREVSSFQPAFPNRVLGTWENVAGLGNKLRGVGMAAKRGC